MTPLHLIAHFFKMRDPNAKLLICLTRVYCSRDVYVASVRLRDMGVPTNELRLEAFHMSCQRRILDIRWYHFVTNTAVLDQTQEDSIISRI